MKTPKIKVICCHHEKHIFVKTSRNKVIKCLLKALRPHADKFDAIAVCGYSMALISPIIAHLLHKELILVRAKDVTAHSTLKVEGQNGLRYIIIDDLIDSGATFRHVVDTIGQKLPLCKCYGYTLWNDGTNKHRFAVGEFIECEQPPFSEKHNVQSWEDYE